MEENLKIISEEVKSDPMTEINGWCEKTESDSPSESGIVKTNMSPGKVVRRKKTSAKNAPQRASFPQSRITSTEVKPQGELINRLMTHEDGTDSSTDKLEGNNPCFKIFEVKTFSARKTWEIGSFASTV